MKNVLVVSSLVLASIGLSLSACVVAPRHHVGAAVVVPMGPPSPRVITRPPPPSSVHIWISGYWTWLGAEWIWIDGYYARRPHPKAYWTPERWEKTRRGWTRRPGYWHHR